MRLQLLLNQEGLFCDGNGVLLGTALSLLHSTEVVKSNPTSCFYPLVNSGHLPPALPTLCSWVFLRLNTFGFLGCKAHWFFFLPCSSLLSPTFLSCSFLLFTPTTCITITPIIQHCQVYLLGFSALSHMRFSFDVHLYCQAVIHVIRLTSCL